MTMKNILKIIAAVFMAVSGIEFASAQEPDPNFHIYLCFGQSNMQGEGIIENVDLQNIPDRLRIMACANRPSRGLKVGDWHSALPPVVRDECGLSVIDYFGRTMVENLPEEVTVGIVPVAVGAASIQHFYKEYQPTDLPGREDWFRGYMKAYGNHPYERLISCARQAQKVGVIKGILLHQGEANCGDTNWPKYVKKVYEDILADLHLSAENVPLIAGEVVYTNQGGGAGNHNVIIDRLPETIATSHVVSAAHLTQKGDSWHFSSEGYRILGCRYATCMLHLMGIEDIKVQYKGFCSADRIRLVDKSGVSERILVNSINSLTFDSSADAPGDFDIMNVASGESTNPVNLSELSKMSYISGNEFFYIDGNEFIWHTDGKHLRASAYLRNGEEVVFKHFGGISDIAQPQMFSSFNDDEEKAVFNGPTGRYNIFLNPSEQLLYVENQNLKSTSATPALWVTGRYIGHPKAHGNTNAGALNMGPEACYQLIEMEQGIFEVTLFLNNKFSILFLGSHDSKDVYLTDEWTIKPTDFFKKLMTSKKFSGYLQPGTAFTPGIYTIRLDTNTKILSLNDSNTN